MRKLDQATNATVLNRFPVKLATHKQGLLNLWQIWCVLVEPTR